ncbi:MAG: tetratricopeptide repeat protein, partial [Chitinispirillaceae bacterium]|nr:tetratricopeptide repeat protein [Chitinispirillaceae bacterium]
YMEQKLYLKARELLLRTVEIEPLHAKSHARLGMVYYYLDYPELAKKAYQTALALNPDDYNTYYNFGELLYNVLKDTVSALKNYKSALSLKPDMYEAAFKIGLICIKNGLTKEAVRYFEEALKSAPSDVRILLQCAAGWERLGNKEKALELYKKILSLDELNSIAKQKIKLLEEMM